MLRAGDKAGRTIALPARLRSAGLCQAARVWRGGNGVGVREHSGAVRQRLIRPAHQPPPPGLCSVSLYLPLYLLSVQLWEGRRAATGAGHALGVSLTAV